MKKLILLAVFGLLLFGCSQKQEGQPSPTLQPSIAATMTPTATPSATVDASEISDIGSQDLKELDELGSDLGGDIPTDDLSS